MGILAAFVPVLFATPAAQWIWADGGPGVNEWLIFRRKFSLPQVSPGATLRIAAADKYWLWLNGRLIIREGGLKSGPTPTGWYVDEVDVSRALQKGDNQIAILVWHYGRPGASHRNTPQGALYVSLEDGTAKVISDAGWKVIRHPAFGQAGGGFSVTLPEQAVEFDARRDPEGWTDPQFDDRSWNAATLLGPPPVQPWGRLVSRPIPQWRDGEISPYINPGELSLPRTGPAELIGRLPFNMQVHPWIELDAQPGREVLIQVERDKKETRYVTRAGRQEFEVPTWGNGHFVKYTIPEGVQVLRIGYRPTGYDSEIVGRFSSSDAGLDLLWSKAVRTAYLCMRDTFMDCPDRERSSWPGDAANIMEITLRGLDRKSDLMIAKTFREFAGWASPKGNLWGAVPTSRFPGSFREFPSQSLLLIGFGLPAYWNSSADREFLKSFYPAMRRYLLDLYAVKDGIVQHRGPMDTQWGPGVQSWYDWGDNVDIEPLDQVLYYKALEALRDSAAALGYSEDVLSCDRLRAQMRDAFDRRYWSDAQKAYMTPQRAGAPDDRVQALAIVTGIAPPERWGSLADFLENNARCSIYMERFPLQALVEAGRPDSALTRLKRRWSAEIASDYSTLPEKFGERSNHAWGGAAIVVLAERAMGISILEPGYRRVRFDPPPTGLEFADYSLPTIHGILKLAFRRGTESVSIQLEIPEGIIVEVPDGNSIRRFGKGSWKETLPMAR
ncbi:alpha-L-rhamnosidase-related protein [Terrimicrobium sacchariphilum]|uniref:alpha-L-rhamnosidase-related protein n=1 Tax=Terrimicrobium sacchariphilum TaxID=690879 RepID=UPI0014716113|nr:alpha-L-rhamnosidase C-terminal domain-containing protein [Terrimicrobium sacchariphilum]